MPTNASGGNELYEALKCLRGFCPRDAEIVEAEIERLRAGLRGLVDALGIDAHGNLSGGGFDEWGTAWVRAHKALGWEGMPS